MKLKGFSLIELMIVIAIIGILAAIAVPSYQSYIYRARTSELISTASSLTNIVNDYIQGQGQGPGIPNCNTITQTPTPTTSNVEANPQPISLADCRITVLPNTVDGFRGIAATAPIINLIPQINTDGSVTWRCTSGASQYAPSTCQ
jgi:type IV pilus assembly protein PilA